VFGYAAFAQAPFASLGESAMPVAFADTATISDSQTVVNSFGGLFNDTATLSDVLNGAAAYLVYIADTATGSDTFSAVLGYNVGIADTVTITDTPTVTATIVASVTGIQLYVYVGSTLVWAVVDDTQNANWQNIDDTQNPGWVNVPT
jgi:tetrahydromethanopterin S-methyltransferase subunit C